MNCFLVAQDIKVQSFAVPLISSGNSGAPKDVCARVLVHAILDFSHSSKRNTTVDELILVNIDKTSTEVIKRSFEVTSQMPSSPPQERYSSSTSARPSSAMPDTTFTGSASHQDQFHNPSATPATTSANTEKIDVLKQVERESISAGAPNQGQGPGFKDHSLTSAAAESQTGTSNLAKASLTHTGAYPTG